LATAPPDEKSCQYSMISHQFEKNYFTVHLIE
jgi:hypothetical protein